MSTSVKTIAPSGRISADLVCVKCSHVLRGVSISARCPECGEPVSSTLAARTLDNIDYARGGLEDYGGTLKLVGIALIGVMLLPVLGPLVAVIMAGAAFVRVSSTGRLMRSGFGRTSRVGLVIRLAHRASWPVAIWGCITTVALLHDAIGRWGVWLSPAQARAMVLVWILMIVAEVVIGVILAWRTAALLEIGWFNTLLRASILSLAIGASVQLLLIATVGAGVGQGGGALLVISQIIIGWAPLLAGGWMLGTLVQRLGDDVEELHWRCLTDSASDGGA